ncbi:hypothetical protein [Labrys neptuniae]|uniref:Uncharacterized protein n=1 Tax=Labrys neptuniae TaxID=376174 RepID=A0ABV3PGI0_9HYPH
MRAKMIGFVGHYLLGRYLLPVYTALMIVALAVAGVFLTASDPGQAIFAFFDQPLAIVLASAIVLLLQYKPIQDKLRDLWRSGLVTVPIALLALCSPALAQTATATAASGFTEILTSVFTATAMSIIGWIAFIFQKRTGLQVEASIRSIEMGHRDAIEKAAGTAATLVMSAVAKGISKSDALAKAASYVESVVPDALAYFGLAGDALEIKIDAKLAELFGTKPIYQVDLGPATLTPANTQ